MCVSKASLTVYFEPPFWVGLYRREDGDGYRVCKTIFGREPRDQEIWATPESSLATQTVLQE